MNFVFQELCVFYLSLDCHIEVTGSTSKKALGTDSQEEIKVHAAAQLYQLLEVLQAEQR